MTVRCGWVYTSPMMVRKIPNDGDEQDAYTLWRRYCKYLQRPGAVKKIKKRTHRRERREAKRDIERMLEDE